MSFSLKLFNYTRFNHSAILPNRLFHLSSSRSNISGSFLQYDKDPGPAFLNQDTQKLLKSMTRLDFEKVFRGRTVLKNDVEYKFLTTQQIEDEVRSATERAEHLLQMPPIVKINEVVHQVISKDPALKNFADSSYVFTDISFGLKDSERTIITRDQDGVLERAPYSTRKRMNQIYFPLQGRKFRNPKMFEGENLKRVLDEHHYEFVMDRLCLQFEPYEKDFHDISSQLYQHLNEHKRFDDLRSTRHFGPLAFFLAWHKIIDDLLLDMVQRDYLKNGVELIFLMFKLNDIVVDNGILNQLREFAAKQDLVKDKAKDLLAPNDVKDTIERKVGKSTEEFEVDEMCFEFIQKFVKDFAVKKSILELAMSGYKERHDQMKNLSAGLLKAHGMN